LVRDTDIRAIEIQDSREMAIDCLPLDAIRKLYQFDVTLWQPMRIIAIICNTNSHFHIIY